jgi:excisionase family DNA binding protein
MYEMQIDIVKYLTNDGVRVMSKDETAALSVHQKPAAMSCETVAKRLGLSVKAIHALVRSGELPAYDLSIKRGGRPRWRIDESALAEFLKSRLVQPIQDTRIQRRRKAVFGVKQFV